MCQSLSQLRNEFVETICIEQEKVWNLRFHNERMNRTRRKFWGSQVHDLYLEDWIHPEGLVERTRCRVVYTKDIDEVAYYPYRMREVKSLKLIVCDEAAYTYKSTDRSLLNTLFEQREEADDVLIVRKGLLTDTSIANIALYDGNAWYTPHNPLLKGTRRQSLLETGQILERELKAEAISHYQKICLFNAMIPFGTIELETSKIL